LAKKDAGESKLFAFLAYLLGIIGFVLVFLVRRNDKFAMYHAKQSLVLCISWIIVYFVGMAIPFIGWFIIMPLGNLLLFILWIFGIVNALSGKEKPLPIIGQFGDKIKL
jgi:uncharacterized membrane protein